MNFLYPEAVIPLFISLIIISVLFIKEERSFFKYVQKFWFYRQSGVSKLSSILILSGFIILSIILLDPRGKEEKIKSFITKDQTVIMIDTSTSMLTEDVKPNRLEKSVWMAKHLVRNIYGHETALLIFADITKKLSPFTEDLDLLDARLDSVKSMRKLQAGSDIKSAIMESVQFFNANQENGGNIIIFTDGEDHENSLDVKIPDKINLILIGVGTERGGPIPLKDNQNLFYGNKKYQGETVTSKLSIDFFKKSASNKKNIHYFIPKHNQLPTTDILSVMEKQKKDRQEQENIIRPVLMDKLAIPGLIFLLFGFLLKNLKAFVFSFLVILSVEAKEEAKFSENALKGIEQLQNNEMNTEQKLALADLLAKEKHVALANSLYEEEFTKDEFKKENINSYFNYGTMLLNEKKYDQALKTYQEIKKWSEKKEVDLETELSKKIKENIERAFSASSSSSKDKNKDQSEEKNNQSGQWQGEGKSGDNQKDPKENKNNDQNPFDPKNKDKEKPEKNPDDKKDEKENKPQDQQESEGQTKPQQKKKMSPLLEQLKSDDRQLQGKFLDTQTQKRLKSRKDW
jgi:Ca-activated chloride channel family protein